MKRETPRRKAVASLRVPQLFVAASVTLHGARPWHPRELRVPFVAASVRLHGAKTWRPGSSYHTASSLLSKFNLTGGDYLSKRTQTLEHILLQWNIYLDHRHCLPTSFTAAEMKTADIHSAFAQDRANAPDDARHVPVAHHQHVTLRRSFDVKAVDFRN